MIHTRFWGRSWLTASHITDDLPKNRRKQIAPALWSVLRHSAVMWDWGGHVGRMAWLGQQAGCRVWSWEPNPAVWHTHQINTPLTHLIPQAITVSGGVTQFDQPPVTLSVGGSVSPRGRLRVRSQAVSWLWRHYPVPSVIKMDCEGHEPLLIEASRSELARHLPWLCVEHKLGGTEQPLRALGYRPWLRWRIDTIWHHPRRPIPQSPPQYHPGYHHLAPHKWHQCGY